MKLVGASIVFEACGTAMGLDFSDGLEFYGIMALSSEVGTTAN